ncbi:MAG TPA: hypothetical protein PLP29_11435 [Candidatus Ozemobacteraceae bacterium]|nr:hypothetical protein [Candidatus Ozemobacteraceae bacterium]
MTSSMGKRPGVTFVEIMIAVLILAAALLPILSTIQYGSKSTVKVNNYSKAMRLALGLVEECKFVPMKTIIKDYEGLADNTWEVLNENYYPKTKESLAEFMSQLKDLKWEGKLKVRKGKIRPNEPEVIREVWIQVDARWTEGDKTGVRQVRISNAIYNAESD